MIPGLLPQHGPDDEAFGHMGAGGQVAFADPVARVGCAFVRNHLENQALPLMGASLVDTLYRCLNGPR
jgi:CubicO group peptidase (beta-lactamase class C family)